MNNDVDMCNIHQLRVTDALERNGWLTCERIGFQVNTGVNWSATIGVMILMSSLLRILERATYPIPLGTVVQSNHSMSFLMLAPWVLQMVMQ